MPTFNKAAKWFRRLMGRGANRDIRPELIPDGLYADGLNIRPASTDGNDGGIEAIKGETLIFPAPDNFGDQYVCIGSASVNNRVIEFWASPDPNNYDPVVRVNGVVVAQSADIPYTYDRPLQIAVLEQCGEGIVYPADHQSPPLFWDIGLLLSNLASGTQAYFDSYDIDLNSVSLSASPELPRHTGNPQVQGNGLPAGQYQYSLRYEAPTGDKTNFGPETALISVGRVHDSVWANTAMPGARTTGGFADVTTPTAWGIGLEFNIDNTQGFVFVEIVRRRFNDGQGVNGPGVLEVVARIPIIPGEFRTIQFIDPVDANFLEIIPQDQEEERQFDILAPKSVEYADNRLTYANFQTAPLVPNFTFTLNADGQALIPITGKATTTVNGVELNSGYTDPVNNTYKKSYLRGERYELAIQGWDAKLAKSYAVPVPGTQDGGYQFPNRRDRKTDDSAIYSDSPIYAVTTDCQSASPVDRTYDAFTQGLFQKTNPSAQTINVMQIPWAPGQIYQYAPWHPSTPDDTNVNGYSVNPVGARVLNFTAPLTLDTGPENGTIWNPQYNALGALIYGIDNIPSNIKAITVVRSQPAGRVVCQGIGTYVLVGPNSAEAPATKSTTNLNFFSRELLNGYVPQNIIEDIQQNPTNYDVQFVCPLGFYTEIYGYGKNSPAFPIPFAVDGLGVDQISYAGIQYDNGYVNAGDGTAGMGYAPAPGAAPDGHYVGYGAWRNNQPPNAQSGDPNDNPTNFSYWNTAPGGVARDGNTTAAMSSFFPIVEGRGDYFRISMEGLYVYSPATGTTNDSLNFNSTDVRNFHQPWYVINIIRREAIVPDGTGQYINTGTTIKMRACVGVSDGSAQQSYRLINERREDVLGYFPTDYRYVYIQQTGQPDQAWVCMTNNAALAPATVLADIASNGFWVAPDGTQVYGLYNARTDGRETYLDFGLWGGTAIASPPDNSRIVVKYNPLAPIRVFGGDTTIAPSTHAIFDRRFMLSEAPTSYPLEEQAANINGLPLPYPGFIRNPQYLMPITSQSVGDDAYRIVPKIKTLRQWCVMFDAESRTQYEMDPWINESPITQDSVRGHYVIKPYDYSDGLSGFWPAYGGDYQNWDDYYNMGGIRFLCTQASYNQDYWKQPNISSIGVPETGFVDRTDYCTGLIASLERDPQLENVPGLRTFIPANLKVISEENGEIKFIGSALGPNGQNMYAWTQDGVCRVLTNKNILTGASGEVISTQSISNYWGDEMWLSRNIGSPDQMWRLLARGYAPAGQQYADSFFWADRQSFYRLTGDTIVDIARGKYLSQVKQSLQNFPSNYTPHATAFYNRNHNEVWFSIDEQIVVVAPPITPSELTLPKRLFVYSAQQNEWVGQFSYDFDSYVQNKGTAYGMRDLSTFILDDGYTISNNTRRASVTVPVVGDMGILKEFTRWAVTGTRPDEIEILDKDYNVICRQNEAIAAATNPTEAQYWVLRYRMGWEQWARAINIVDDVIFPTDVRPQDELFYLRCTWFTEGDKECVALSANYQNIK